MSQDEQGSSTRWVNSAAAKMDSNASTPTEGRSHLELTDVNGKAMARSNKPRTVKRKSSFLRGSARQLTH